MVSVLTLTVVYAALSITLNINGNAEVSSASWDIYLDNVKLNSQSSTTNIPTITDKTTASFSTTLTVSPHKNATLINNIGYELEKKYDINWLPTDYKKEEGYKKSIELSKKYNLYRQDYCGCKYSVRKTNYSQKENYSKE